MNGAVIYSRVSSETDDRTASLDTQEQLATRFAESKGFSVVGVFRERYSGASLYERQILTDAREMIRSGRAKALVCHSIDRLSRDPVHLMILLEEAQRAGAEILFTTEELDATSEGKLISYVRGYAAAVEREKIKERTQRAKRLIVDRGGLIGVGPCLFGYNFNKETRKREINEEEAKIVRRIFDLYDAGFGHTRVVRHLQAEGYQTPSVARNLARSKSGVWCERATSMIARNEAYCGVTYVMQHAHKPRKNKERKPKLPPIRLPDDVTPPIVTREQFDRVNALLDTRRRERSGMSKSDSDDKNFLMRGLVKCGVCGKSCWVMPSGKYTYYRCCNYRGKKQTRCEGKSVQTSFLDNLAWEAVERSAKDPQSIIKGLELLYGKSGDQGQNERELEILKQKLKEQARIADKLYNAWKLEEDADISARLMRDYRDVNDIVSMLKSEVSQVTARIKAADSPDKIKQRILDMLATVRTNLPDASPETKRNLIEGLQIRATIDGPKKVAIEIGTNGATLASKLQQEIEETTKDLGSCDGISRDSVANSKKKKARQVVTFGPWVLVS